MEGIALIIVDMQNDFAHPQGALYVPGGQKLAFKINNWIDEAARNCYYDTLIGTMDWHPENHYSFIENGGRWPKHCVKGSWGAQIIKPLDGFFDEESLIAKGVDAQDRNDYSGFSGHSLFDDKTLQEILLRKNIGEVDIVGLALDYCVKFTALDSIRLGFKTTVLRNYTKAVNINPGDGDRAIEEMEKRGIKINTDVC